MLDIRPYWLGIVARLSAAAILAAAAVLAVSVVAYLTGWALAEAMAFSALLVSCIALSWAWR